MYCAAKIILPKTQKVASSFVKSKGTKSFLSKENVMMEIAEKRSPLCCPAHFVVW